MKLHPPSFPTSTSLIFDAVTTSLSKLLWQRDGRHRKWKQCMWWLSVALHITVSAGLHFVIPDTLCVMVSAVLHVMASAALFLSVPALAWVAHRCVFSPYSFHLLQGKLEPFSTDGRSWAHPRQVTTANRCYIQPATSAHCSRYGNRDGLCVVMRDGLQLRTSMTIAVGTPVGTGQRATILRDLIPPVRVTLW